MFSTNSITSTGARAEFFDGVLPIDSTSRWSPYNLDNGRQQDGRGLWAAVSALLNMALDARQANLQVDHASQSIRVMMAMAYETVQFSTNRAVARQATLLLNEFERVLRRYPIEQLPQLHALELADHSLFFEWVLPSRRAGITVDANPAQSGWFLLADDHRDKYERWGYLGTIDFAAIIQHMQQGILTPAL